MSVTYDDDLMMKMSSGIASIIEAQAKERAPFLPPQRPTRARRSTSLRSRHRRPLAQWRDPLLSSWYWVGPSSEARPHSQRHLRLRAFSALGEPPAPSESLCSLPSLTAGVVHPRPPRPSVVRPLFLCLRSRFRSPLPLVRPFTLCQAGGVI